MKKLFECISLIYCLFILLFGFSSIANADEYVQVMSKDDNVCQHMLKLYNADLRKYGRVRCDKHEEFNAIKWGEKKTYTTYPEGKKRYSTPSPDTALVSRFDINNDGVEEIVVKFNQAILKGILSEAMYYFSDKEIDHFNGTEFDVNRLYTKAIGSMGTMAFKGNGYPLKQLPKVHDPAGPGYPAVSYYEALGGHFRVNPFVFKGTYYIDMRDDIVKKYSSKYFVILKYTKENQPTDICYFLRKTHSKNIPKGGK